MESSSPMLDHSYCRLPSQQTKCDNRLGVKKQLGLLGMEASSPVVSENLPTKGNPTDRSICFQTISSNQNILFVEAGATGSSSRCLLTKLVPQTSMAITTVVPRNNKNLRTTTNFTDLVKRSLKKSKRRNSFPYPKQNLKISGINGLRAKLQKEGVSREVFNIVIKSRKPSWNESTWGRWAILCSERKIDPFFSIRIFFYRH